MDEGKSSVCSGQDLYRRAKRRIPGGTQLLSKRPEMILPDQWPSYYTRAKGIETWGLDGMRYKDMSYSAIGACILGFADPDVDRAVVEAISSGTTSTLNCPEEVDLADLLCELHPWADMVRYARGGGEAMALAVRIARAKTKCDKVAFCGYHGWHDWYLSANLAQENALDGHLLPGLDPAGVPRGLIGTALPFHYNRINELEAIVSDTGNNLAAIISEPLRNYHPEPGFLEKMREIATETGAVLIFDEVSAAWRLNTGGAHLLYGVNPDIAVFAKAMSNGYPMAAVIGREDVMQAAQSSFISSTSWTEKIGPVAAIATIKKHQRLKVADHLIHIGSQIQSGWRNAAKDAGLSIDVTGIAPMGHFEFLYPNAQALRTLFTQIMLEKGFLATNAFYASYAHQNHHVNEYLQSVKCAFEVLARAIEMHDVESLLKGPVAHKGFSRLT